MKKLFLYLGSMFIPVIALLLVVTQVVEAACTTGNSTRLNWNSYWSFQCNVPSAFQSKVTSAVNTWDASDKYTYVAGGVCPPYAFNWGYTSFSAAGYGSSPGTTFTYRDSNNKITGASSYFNSDKTWFDSTVENQNWPSGQFDRRTVALHEIGHWMYINHPSACGQSHPEAVMEPTYVTKTYLRSDDLLGLAQLGILK